jgi:hypothetical protein
MIDDFELRVLAASQHGLVSVEQAIGLGFDGHRRHHLTDSRRWRSLDGRVYALVGAPYGRAWQASNAVLAAGPGAGLGGESSLAWWQVPGMRLQPFQIVRPRGHSDRSPAGMPHVPVLLPDHHIVTLDGVRAEVPARALFDFAGSMRHGAKLPWWHERVARAVDNAWSLRLVSGESLHAMLDEMAQRGRPGITVMRAVLAERGLDYVPPASALESRLARLLERAGIPPMRRQVDVGDGSRWIGRVDLRDAEFPLILEMQSERFHSSLLDAQLDATRIDRLRAAGYVVVEITEADLWERPADVVARVRAARLEAALAAHHKAS